MKLFVVVSILLLLFACGGGGNEEVNLRLTSDQRRAVDTLVANQVKKLRPFYDSTCVANFDEMVEAATDSIVQRRLEEEARLRARIPLQNQAGR
jgi:hypothetical protein